MKIWHDEPFADSAWPTFAVSKLAREYSKVVLTGDGGGSYLRLRWYQEFNRIQNLQKKVPNFKSITRNKGFRLVYSGKYQSCLV